MRLKKIALIIGTRPEVIKTASIIRELLAHPKEFDLSLIVSAQHREMMDQMLKVFKIQPKYDFDIMVPNQSLFHISTSVLKNLEKLWSKKRPLY